MAFFPDEYKVFAYRAGDVLASEEGGKIALTRILSVDRVAVGSGETISIQGQAFTAPEDDYLLIVHCALGEPEFATADDARAAFSAGRWVPYVGHAPMRTIGFAPRQTVLANASVSEDELVGYRQWQASFAAGEAGIF